MLESIEDTIVPLGNFYFNNSKKGIIKKMPKKWKLEDVSILDKPEHTIMWNLIDVKPQQMENNNISMLGSFYNVIA